MSKTENNEGIHIEARFENANTGGGTVLKVSLNGEEKLTLAIDVEAIEGGGGADCQIAPSVPQADLDALREMIEPLVADMDDMDDPIVDMLIALAAGHGFKMVKAKPGEPGYLLSDHMDDTVH